MEYLLKFFSSLNQKSWYIRALNLEMKNKNNKFISTKTSTQHSQMLKEYWITWNYKGDYIEKTCTARYLILKKLKKKKE
jgi:hypothetical protein